MRQQKRRNNDISVETPVKPENYGENSIQSMSDRSFFRISEFIQTYVGIKLPIVKKVMVQSRIMKRMRFLKITDFEEYIDYAFSKEGMQLEMPNMIDVITTNKSDFFRESGHFEYLVSQALPEIQKSNGRRETIKILSAGCATGEEVYTLAMVLSDYRERYPDTRFSIKGIDISGNALEKAVEGIYPEYKIGPIPEEYRKRYLMRSKDKSKALVRITPQLRSAVAFTRANILDNAFDLSHAMDVIFFRNVLIYFDRPTQQRVLAQMIKHLHPLGFLFIGHSETLTGLDLPLVSVSYSVYRKHGKIGRPENKVQ